MNQEKKNGRCEKVRKIRNKEKGVIYIPELWILLKYRNDRYATGFNPFVTVSIYRPENNNEDDADAPPPPPPPTGHLECKSGSNKRIVLQQGVPIYSRVQ
jgi:hypothetical protein